MTADLTAPLTATLASLESGWPIDRINRARRVQERQAMTSTPPKHSIGAVADIDAAILAMVGRNVPMRAGQICDLIGEAAHVKSDAAHRPVDRAIQRLRKAGRIRLVSGPGGGWIATAVVAQPAPTKSTRRDDAIRAIGRLREHCADYGYDVEIKESRGAPIAATLTGGAVVYLTITVTVGDPDGAVGE